jgi:hypothetical protein
MIAVPLRQALPRLKVCRATLLSVRTRIFIGVGAWLLGAVTATCGSLLAVSLLGTGFGVSAGQGQQLTAAAVSAALASAPKEHTAPPAGHRSTAPPKAHHARAKHASSPPVTPVAPVHDAQTGTLLASPAGTVVASCGPAGAYLVSWSPAQGYGSEQIVRGPAAIARVMFDAGSSSLTMAVSCHAGTPVADPVWGHDDDGGSGSGGYGGGDN